MKSIFTEGKSQSIADVLNTKDERSRYQQKLQVLFSGLPVVVIKLNIPGPIKNNKYLKNIFDLGYSLWKDENRKQIVFENVWDKNTGKEAFVVLEQNLSLELVKRQAVNFEDRYDLGRLFDIDVMGSDNDNQSISRTQFNLPARKCLICDRPAKECSRSRRHSVEEMQVVISQMYQLYVLGK